MPEEIKKKVGVGVGVMVLRDSRILLGKRHADPAKADSELHGESSWTMPGGKMDFGETPETTATRELKEETSLEATGLKVICVSNDKVTDAHFVTIGLLCEDFTGEVQIMEPDEITEWRWFDLNGLPEPIFFPSARVLRNYLDKTFYQSFN
ncbi:MAG: NUDIX domain-containing protein [Patescibacteria group bacterium]|jgi:8-oxo-dGTP diphosphatase